MATIEKSTYKDLPLYIYEDHYPRLEIVQTAGWKAGNCYYKQSWRVRSTKPLKEYDLETWIYNITHTGQGYSYTGLGKEPAGYVTDQKCQKEGYIPQPFWEYEINTSIDSSG